MCLVEKKTDEHVDAVAAILQLVKTIVPFQAHSFHF